MKPDALRILITGANGRLGRQIIAALCDSNHEVRALVRSEAAAQSVTANAPRESKVDVQVVDYKDRGDLAAAARDCHATVHLVGILKESRTTRYEDAHELSCGALGDALDEVDGCRVVYPSILGSRSDSANRCLASKGRAESELTRRKTPACIVRLPMVLGRDDPATQSLRAQALSGFVPLLRGGRTWQQPIDSRDVVRCIVRLVTTDLPITGSFDLAGPESLRHRDLVRRVAALHGRSPRILPIPAAPVLAFARILERLAHDPPITRTMLEVLEHDDRIDPRPAYDSLGVEPTPLDTTLRDYLGPEENER